MNSFKTLVRSRRYWATGHSGVGLCAVGLLVAGVLMTGTAQAARGGGFGGRSSGGRGTVVSVSINRGFAPRGVVQRGGGFSSRFGGSWGWRNYWCWPGSLVYPDVIYNDPSTAGNVIWPANYVKGPQSTLPIVVVAPRDSAPAVPENTGQMVYDARGSPVGIILRNADGSPQFVPVSP